MMCVTELSFTGFYSFLIACCGKGGVEKSGFYMACKV